MIERVKRPDLEEVRDLFQQGWTHDYWRARIHEVLDYALQLEQDAAKARVLVDTIEQHCPCGARPESPQTHPHNGGCPVAALKTLLAAGS